MIDFKSFQIPKYFKKSLELALTANVLSSFGNSLFFSITKTWYFFLCSAIAAKDPTNPAPTIKKSYLNIYFSFRDIY